MDHLLWGAVLICAPSLAAGLDAAVDVVLFLPEFFEAYDFLPDKNIPQDFNDYVH
jgi:hypothetical protein